jgi:hypothetical protein
MQHTLYNHDMMKRPKNLSNKYGLEIINQELNIQDSRKGICWHTLTEET